MKSDLRDTGIAIIAAILVAVGFTLAFSGDRRPAPIDSPYILRIDSMGWIRAGFSEGRQLMHLQNCNGFIVINEQECPPETVVVVEGK